MRKAGIPAFLAPMRDPNMRAHERRRFWNRPWIWALVLVLIVVCGYLAVPGNRSAHSELELQVADLTAHTPLLCRVISGHVGRSLKAGRSPLLPRLVIAYAETKSFAVRQKRSAARIRLSERGTNVAPVFPALFEALDDPDFEIRWAALDVLFNSRIDQSPAFRDLRVALAGRTRPVEVFSYVLRSDLAPFFNMGMSNADARRFALLCLPSCDVTPALVPVLAQLVRDTNQGPPMRALAVLALAHHGTGNQEAESLVRARFSDPAEWPEVRAAAGRSLIGRVPNSELKPVLREMLRSPETRARVGAAEVLWAMEAPAEEILPVLQTALSHPLASVRSATLKVLQQMGLAALPALDSIKPLLLDARDDVRRDATNALVLLQTTQHPSGHP